jgi:hypothetical protein
MENVKTAITEDSKAMDKAQASTKAKHPKPIVQKNAKRPNQTKIALGISDNDGDEN